jgi:hypothetical protein
MFDPELEATNRDSGMSHGQLDTPAAKQQEDGIESFLSLLVGTTADSQPQLLDGAVFRIRVMTRATDAPLK